MAQTGAIELLKLLNKYLLTVTYEYGENYSIRFENGPLFYSIQNEKNTIWTALILMPNDQQISLRMQYWDTHFWWYSIVVWGVALTSSTAAEPAT